MSDKTRSLADVARDTRDGIQARGEMTQATYDLLTLMISAAENAVEAISKQRDVVNDEGGVVTNGVLDGTADYAIEAMFMFAAAFDATQDVEAGRYPPILSSDSTDPVVH